MCKRPRQMSGKNQMCTPPCYRGKDLSNEEGPTHCTPVLWQGSNCACCIGFIRSDFRGKCSASVWGKQRQSLESEKSRLQQSSPVLEKITRCVFHLILSLKTYFTFIKKVLIFKCHLNRSQNHLANSSERKFHIRTGTICDPTDKGLETPCYTSLIEPKTDPILSRAAPLFQHVSFSYDCGAPGGEKKHLHEDIKLH